MPTIANLPILNSVSVPPLGTKLAPKPEGVGQSQDLGVHGGGQAQVKFTNGTTGPTLSAGATIYGSHDGSDWVEINTVWGDTVSAGAPAGAYVDIAPSIRYVRGDAWGNTGQNVTVQIRVLFISNT